MRALVQRVTEARVEVAGAVIGEIGPGLLILVCAMQGDDADTAEKLAAKIAKLRLFRDGDGKTNLALGDVQSAALVVSQFTLAPDEGERLYLHFAKTLQSQQIPVATGRFGAEMQVHLVNDGPMTIWLDTAV